MAKNNHVDMLGTNMFIFVNYYLFYIFIYYCYYFPPWMIQVGKVII